MTLQNKILARGERNLPARVGQPLLPDEENACFAFGPRTYSPAMGRFLSPDPLWESFRNANPYHYCFNNPISYKDPSGLAPEKEKSKEDELQRTEDEYEKRLREHMFLQECYRIEAAMLKALTPDWLTNGSYGTFEPFNSGISYIEVGGGPGGGGDGNSGKTGSNNGLIYGPGLVNVVKAIVDVLLGGSSEKYSGKSGLKLTGIDSDDPAVRALVQKNFDITVNFFKMLGMCFNTYQSIIDNLGKIAKKYNIYAMNEESGKHVFKDKKIGKFYDAEIGNSGYGHCKENATIYISLLGIDQENYGKFQILENAIGLLDELNHANNNLYGVCKLKDFEQDQTLYQNLLNDYNNRFGASEQPYYFEQIRTKFEKYYDGNKKKGMQ